MTVTSPTRRARRRQPVALVSSLLLAMAAMACGTSDSDKPADAGSDAMAPAKELTEQDVHEACVRMHACEVERHPRLGDCINTYRDVLLRNNGRELYARAYACVNAAQGDCKLIRQCLGFEGKPRKNCDINYVPKCVGDVAHNCDLLVKWEQRLDCSQGGLKCGVKQVDGKPTQAVCGGGPCDLDKDVTTCRDDALWLCVGGAYELEDCAAGNLQCRDPVAAVCEGKGRSCREFAAECRGNTIIRCKNGYVWELDCGKTRRCDPDHAICVPGGADCSTDSFFDTCDGDQLRVCIDGFARSFDCKALGFLGCTASATGHGDACKAAPVYD